MNITESNELTDVLDRVRDWSPSLRIALAKEILDSLRPAIATTVPRGRSPRGLSAAEVQGLLKTDRPAPDDETVKQWIDEHRIEKYT